MAKLNFLTFVDTIMLTCGRHLKKKKKPKHFNLSNNLINVLFRRDRVKTDYSIYCLITWEWLHSNLQFYD